jgi:DsbC/DsbD-like thiol-disulfide interchange protein
MTLAGISVVLALAMSASAEQTATKHLSVATSGPAGAVVPGTRVSLTIDVTPKPEMHVYAPEQKDFIPISLVLEANPRVKVHAARYPKPEKYKPLDETQLVYTRPFRIVQDVTVAATPAMVERAKTPGATLTIKGTLKYQACDNSICYAPVTVPVAWSISLKSPTTVSSSSSSVSDRHVARSH